MELWEVGLALGGSFLVFLSGLCTGWWLKAIAVSKEMERIEEAEAMLGIDRMKAE